MTAPWAEYTWDGVEGWLWDAKAFVEKNYDPESGVAIIFLAPPGGRATVPVMAIGPRGFTPIIDPDVDVTEIDHDDPDPVTSTWATTDPGDEETPPTIKESRTVRKGPPGVPGSFAFLGATDLSGSPAAGYIPAYTPTGPGVIWTPPKVGGQHWPAAIATAAEGENAKTLCPIPIPAYPFPHRQRVHGWDVVTGTGANVVVDLIARLNNATTGDEIARAVGRAGVAPPVHTFVSAPPAGSASGYGRVEAGATSTVYIRAERQSGSDTFITAGGRYMVEVVPIP